MVTHHIHKKVGATQERRAMHLTDEDIQEFIRIWKEEFGEDITPEAARAQATELLELYALLARPLRKKDSPDPGTKDT